VPQQLQGLRVSRISLAVVPHPKRSISAVSLERGCYHQEAGIYEEANFGEAETL
jgi:hypothetical protein